MILKNDSENGNENNENENVNDNLRVVQILRVSGQLLFYIFFMKDILKVKNTNKSTSSNFYLYNIHKQKHFK